MAPPRNSDSGGGGGKKRGARPKKNRGAATTNGATGRARVYSECTEDHCAVCLNRMRIFSVGRCNHPVCSECSVRMRILCDQKECPICRQDMDKVVHTVSRRRFEDVENNVYPMDRRYRICFEDDAVQKAYKLLVEFRCPICGGDDEPSAAAAATVFATFKQLDQHVRRQHEMFFCDLCTEHLKIFSHERKLYSRSDLALHRRKGDPDDSSHKGHPLCEYCQVRYVDKDELYRHLRKDHFFCHFCDADGLHVYYENYPGLQHHFREEHFLCEEGGCRDEQFTSAFRTEIDLKAHVCDRHEGGLSKAAVRLNRTVDLEFNFTRPGAHNQVNRRRGRGADDESGEPEDRNFGYSSLAGMPDMSTENFPSLSGRPSSGTALSGSSGKASKSWSRTGPGSAALDEEFPSLGGGEATGSSQARPAALNYKKMGRASGSNHHQQPQDDYPVLASSAKDRSLLSNFSNASSAKAYRNPTGYKPAWQQSSDDGKPPPKPSRKTPAPMPDIGSDYPSLAKPESPRPKPPGASPSKVQKKPSNGGRKAPTTLASAADLISEEPSRPSRNGPSGMVTLVKAPPRKPPDDERPAVSNVGSKKPSKASKPSSSRSPVSDEDFPSLTPGTKKISANFVRAESPPAAAAKPSRNPPPGFGGTRTKTKPPPGFHASRAVYLQPSDFVARNLSLLEAITGLVDADPSKLKQFKELSRQFRSGVMSCKEYHDHCIDVFGVVAFERFFPELLALLPDIPKQQELYAVHVSKYPKSVLPVTPCARCGQVVGKSEHQSHFKQHVVDSDFPQLSLG